MNKKVIRLTELELERYIGKVISEQQDPNVPELGGDGNKGEIVKSGSGGDGTDSYSRASMSKIRDNQFNNRKDYIKLMGVFNKMSVKLRDIEQSSPKYKDATWVDFDSNTWRNFEESNSKYSSIRVVRKPYLSNNSMSRFMVLFTQTINNVSDVVNEKPILKIGYTPDRGVHTVVTNTYTWPFDVNKVESDFEHMTFQEGATNRQDIQGVKNLSLVRGYDYDPNKRPSYNGVVDKNGYQLKEGKKKIVRLTESELKNYISKVVSENKVIINENNGKIFNDIEEFRMISRRVSQQFEVFEEMVKKGDIRRANEEKEITYKYIVRLINILMLLKVRLK